MSYDRQLQFILNITAFTIIAICIFVISYELDNQTRQVPMQQKVFSEIPATQENNKQKHIESEHLQNETSVLSSYPYAKIQLQKDIENILQDEKQNYGIFITDLNSPFSLGFNEDKLFMPASIYKVPLAMLVLKDIEQGRYTLNSTLTLQPKNKHYTTDLMYTFKAGTSYSTETLLYYIIHFSDNCAWNMLQDNIGSTAELDQRFNEELGLEYTRRVPFQTTAEEVGEIFEMLYMRQYLNHENSTYLIDLLKNVTVSHNDRIAAGVPEKTQVAHKIGNFNGIWQDAGIVFGPETDYIIVVLNKNTTIADAKDKIPCLSNAVWRFFQNTGNSTES